MSETRGNKGSKSVGTYEVNVDDGFECVDGGWISGAVESLKQSSNQYENENRQSLLLLFAVTIYIE